MALVRENLLKTIIERMAWLATQCKFRGLIHLFDANTISHEFFRLLLNETFNLDLLVLDRIQQNFPAIDLGDETKKRSFQITSDKSSKKIQSTIDKFIDHNLVQKYGTLQVIIIGEKQNAYNNLSVPPAFSFSWKEDIIDIGDLIGVIEQLETVKLERIAEIVQSEIRYVNYKEILDLHVSVYSEPREKWQGWDDTRLCYSLGRLEDSTIVIEPKLPYLDLMNAGGPIEPRRYITSTWCPFDWNLPCLDIKILNRTSNPIFLAEAVIDVEESVLDPAPVIVLREDTYRSFAGFIKIINEGSTDLENLMIKYQLLPGVHQAPSVFPDAYPFSESLGTMEEGIKLDIYGAFGDTDVDLEKLESLLSEQYQRHGDQVTFRDENNNESIISFDEYEQLIQNCLGPYQEGIGTVIGELSFTTPMADGGPQSHTIKFTAQVRIFDERRRGMLKPPTFTYHADFEVGKNRYQKRISISHYIEPGHCERFLVQIQANQSSHHKFRISFQDTGEQTVQSPPIQLRCFIPRTRKGRTEQLQTLDPVPEIDM